MAEERLQKVLAQAGYGSRRACEDLIATGRVTVDGAVVKELGAKVDPNRSQVAVDGKPIASERLRYIMLHKPAGYLSHPDPRAGYPDWRTLVKAPERLFPVGRLDQDSEGLLLLTNDGELAYHLTHPSFEHPKAYLVQVTGVPDARKVRRLQHGIMLDDGPTAPAEAVLLRVPPKEFADRAPAPGSAAPRRTSWLKVTLREGRKRQLRRMVGRLGHPALRVIRIGLGPLWMGSLAPGRWRDLTPDEVKALRATADAPAQTPPPAPPVPAPKRLKSAPGRPRAEFPPRIAIDGPSASGKSTIGRLLAHELGYLYFDTGVMYRAVAALALAQGVPVDDEAAVTDLARRTTIEILPPTVKDGRDVTVLANGEDITTQLRDPEVERAVSPVSAYPGVRRVLVEQQRRIARDGGVVMVGRDIGTVVLPNAELKLYLDAAPEARARRRYLERMARGETVTFDQVHEDLIRRDQYDATRQHSPLSAASDAIVVDTTERNVEQVMVQLRTLLRRRFGRKDVKPNVS
jgi:cytidylate kinase